MRRLSVIVGIVLAMALAAPVVSKTSCSVSPQQVPLGSAFTITATGLTPNSDWYWVMVTQAKDPSNNGHPNWSITIGPDGTGTTTIPSTTWSSDGILTTGAAKVRVYPSNGTMKGTANCSFTVVP